MMIHQFTSGLKDRPSPKSGQRFPESRLATSKNLGVVGLSQESRSYYPIIVFAAFFFGFIVAFPMNIAICGGFLK